MNQPDHRLDFLIHDLPSPESARRFFEQFAERNPAQTARLQKNDGLFSDILTLASYSPLLAATLIQHPEYVSWLAGKRSQTAVSGKDELLESLARFALTNSQIEPHVMLARFRRRELLRIFLRDIRGLGTIAEITEEISNLADAILEHAVSLARQEMDNRFGKPFETDDKGRRRPSEACVVALGKLGSKELNYSSDIDLLFMYSGEGSTTGTGSASSVTNREYFVKFAEAVRQLVGKQTGEGAAYRVDMRLRPYGRVGSLALSLNETARYYLTEARSWEQQVLIRSRSSAGDASVFKRFFALVQGAVFRPGRDPKEALREVYLSKEKIDQQRRPETPFDVKLGTGGIREIEFIAQALQLAHGGTDRWLRAPHTLISISRLADRGLLSENERSGLSNAYDFLRRLEHVLQMEHGLQTHSLPGDPEKLELVAAKMRFNGFSELEQSLADHTGNVHTAFIRVFGSEGESTITGRSVDGSPPGFDDVLPDDDAEMADAAGAYMERQILASMKKDRQPIALGGERSEVIRRISAASTHFAQLIASRPGLIKGLTKPSGTPALPDYESEFQRQVDLESGWHAVLGQMRNVWARLMLEITAADVYEVLPVPELRSRQSLLAEASIRTAVRAAARELSAKHPSERPPRPIIFGLGKLGSGTLDYGSDLDLIIAYFEDDDIRPKVTLSEFYSRFTELFVTLLSGMTRDGNLYRVDLRLRPYGKNGPNVSTVDALRDYIENAASIWELLAYVQMRAVPIGPDEEDQAEFLVRESIERRAAKEGSDQIRREARGMRLKLEKAHGSGRGGREIDIKFGSGGLLDIYFVVRYLHLAHPAAVAPGSRSTPAKLEAFGAAGLLSADDNTALREGHGFLSALDHNLRLAFGRSSRLPQANHDLLARIATRIGLGSESELIEQLALHRMNIRSAFENVFAEPGI
ncbi:MAG: hypothetical protein AB7F88_16545 [Pyrinomonadaceae bacterium]